MDDPRLLWARRAGLAAEEAESLRASLEADPTLRADCLADLRLDGALRGFALADRDSEPFVQGVLHCLRARRDETRFVRKVESALRSRRRSGAAAASLAAASVLALLLSSGLRPGGLARLELVEGDAFVASGGTRSRAERGASLSAGQRVETAGEDGRVRIACSGGARLELGAETAVEGVSPSSFRLLRGSVEVRSARPLSVAVPHGELTIEAGEVRLQVSPGMTRIEAVEGRAAFRRTSDERAAAVPGGHVLLAGAAGELAVRPVPIDEIALLPARARLAGDRWRAARDDQASSGSCLELSAPAGASPVEFVFAAEAHKEYAISIRARATGTPRPSVLLEPVDGAFVSRCASWESAAFNAFAFDAHVLHEDYGWMEEGHSIVGRAGREDADRLPDLTRAVLRFHRSGPQTLRLYASGASLRVDVIRLTATRRTGAEISHGGRGGGKG